MPIAGIISSRPSAECERQVAAMVASLKHEQFKLSGTQSWPELGLYAGWTAQPGSFAAAQVFANEVGDVQLLFSGECFGESGLRSQLMRKGHVVGPASGDWLVHQYEELGEKLFASLNGLFSGLLIDRRQGVAFLFNDRYGIERLYWCAARGATYFASEAKALLVLLPELRAFNPEGLAQLLSYGCTLDSTTLFRGVRLAPSGSLWRIVNGQCERGSYFNPAQWEAQTPLAEAEFQEAFDATFRRVAPGCFPAGQRVGVALTGGLDTRLLMACRPVDGPRPVTYTYVGPHGETLDARVAARVAAACGLEHHLVRLGPDFFAEFESLVERTVRVTDGCFGALGAHEIYLNALARRHSPVRLTGVFGSEILRGVSTFKPQGLSRELWGAALPTSALEERSDEWARLHPVTFATFREIPWSIFGSLAACRSQVTFRTPFLDNELVALAYRAPASARRSPATAVRFLERTAPELAAIPTDRGLLGRSGPVGRALRRMFAEVTFKLDYYHNEGMPDALTRGEGWLQAANRAVPLFGHHKFLHYRRWFRHELADALRALAAEDALAAGGVFDRATARRMVEEHINGRRNHVADLGAALTVRAIERTLLRA